MRIAAVITALVLAALTGVAAIASSSSTPTIPCSDIVGLSKSGRMDRYRVVLGVVSVPPAYQRQAAGPTGTRPWTYGYKAGLVVHGANKPVTVSVPRSWRKRVAITWGNETGIVSSLRIASCPVQSPAEPWNAYAGGFYLRTRSACVPLTFRVGQRSTTVRFGIGRRCSA